MEKKDLYLSDEQIDGLHEPLLALKYHSQNLEWQAYRKISQASTDYAVKKVIELLADLGWGHVADDVKLCLELIET